MIPANSLTNYCVQSAWWEYEFDNGHAATVWLDARPSAAFRFSIEASDEVAGRRLAHLDGLFRLDNLTTDQIEERLTLLAALPKKENQ